MIISAYEAADLDGALGIEMGSIDRTATPAAWARVAPGGRSDPDRHDECEIWVIVQGVGDVVVDAGRHRVTAGTVVAYEPFETHVVENTGDTDLVFVTFYWRDAGRAQAAAGRRGGGASANGRSSSSRPRRPRTGTCTSATCQARTWEPTRTSGTSG
ncbi:cupin domain-containing protein [Actinomadura yumaensis]|uniref:cupin domain-containing protein n=1 Tax=Actinomadura TaxID=1988 RepID=UPI0019D52EE0|nr:cupin domain-containing protein [Actinomadura sp. J1-007]